MLHALSQIDAQFFLFLNTAFACRPLDVFFVYITTSQHWVLPLSVVALLLVVRVERGGGLLIRLRPRDTWRTGLAAVLLAAVVVGLTDPLCDRIIKPLCMRPRPCNPQFLVDGGHYLLGYKRSLSMPSIHAANMFGMATALSCFFRRGWPWFGGVALLVGYSRIYVGVHYPGDVIVGAAVGISCGLLVYAAYVQARAALRRRDRRTARAHGEASAATPSGPDAERTAPEPAGMGRSAAGVQGPGAPP